MQTFEAQRRAEALFHEGVDHLQHGRRKRAAACFSMAWQATGLPTALNNLGAIHYEDGDAAAALKAIQPILDAREPMPYTHALASMCYNRLGEAEAAHRQLRLAIADFDKGLAKARAVGSVHPAWVEYTVFIKRAAGGLGEHDLVLRLHRRWPGQSLTFGLHYAGVAAFNLGKYAQAARLWRDVPDPNWGSVTQLYALVAEMIGRGLVPPFPLEYEIIEAREMRGVSPEGARERVRIGRFRVIALAAAFKQVRTQVEASALVEALIFNTGEWGLDLSQRWLQAPTLPLLLKRGVESALGKRTGTDPQPGPGSEE